MINQQWVQRGWQMVVTVMLAMISQSAMAATYTYSAGATNTAWAAGTNWNAVPVSAADTTLAFAGTVGAASITSTDDIAGAFLLNVLTLGSGHGTIFTTRNFSITPSSGSNTFLFSVNGATTPVLNLNTNNGGLGSVTVTTVSVNGAIDGGTLTIQGNGNSTFNYSGILSDGSSSAGLVKNGSSYLALSGANSFTGGVTLNAGGLNLNNASAIGTGSLTITGGSLNNSSGTSITLSTNNAQNWNGDFSFGSNAFSTTSALNLGTGAVVLGGNRVLTVGGAATGTTALTVGGVIDDGVNTYGLTMAGSANQGTGTLILTNSNTYGGPTTINAGVLQLAAITSLGGSGADTLINSGGTLSTAYALDSTTLARIAAGSTGTVAMAGSSSGNNLNFTGLNVSLGASGTSASTYTGTLTSNGTVYRLGGGYGTLNFNSALNAAGNSLVVGGGGTPGTVNLGVAGSYSGGTAVIGGIGTSASILQTNVTGTTTPFGSGAVSLNNGVLGFGTAPTPLTAGQSMAATIGAVTFQGQNEIRLAKGASTQPVPVSLTIDSLNRTNGILYITPSGAATLGATEKVFVTNSGSISLTPVNGMISGSVINGLNKTFLTYGANGLVDATTTATYGSNNIVNLGADPAGTVRAYALRLTATPTNSGNNLFIGAGGLIMNSSAHNAGGTLNFGSSPALIGLFGAGTGDSFNMAINATGGATFYGAGAKLLVGGLNVSGGLNFANGTWMFNTQPTGAEMFQTTNPNAVYIGRGATVTNYQNSKFTVASLSGDGLITSNNTDGSGSAFQVTINGLTDVSSTTFSGGITDLYQSTVNIVKTGLNTQIFNGVNTYRGGTTVNGGTLKGTQISGTPFGTGNITLGGGTLSVSPEGSSANVALTGANLAGSTFTFNAGSQVNLDKGSNTSLTYTVGNTGASANSVLVRGTNGTLILAPASGIANLGTGSGEKFIVNGGVTTTNGIVSAAIIGQDNGSSKSGTFLGYDATNGLVSGTYTDTNFSAASTTSVEDVTSATSVNSQTIFALRSSSVLTLNAGQTLTIGNGSLPAGVILNGGSITGGTALAFGAAPAVVYSSLDNGSISSAITGSGGISVTGPGVTTFSGANTYTTSTSVNDSTLSISSNGNLGNANNSLILNGGTLASTATINLGTTRGVTLNIGQNTLGGTFDVATGTNLTVGGVVSGTGSLYKSGAGDLRLSGTNTFNGFTTVSAGTVTLLNSLALQNSTLLSGGIVFDSSVVSHAFTLAGLSGNFNLTLEDNAITPNAVALSVGNSSIIGTAHSGVLSGSGSLLKINTGNLTLSGANTYTGQTKIQNGTLTVSSLNSVAGGSSSSNLGAPVSVANGTIGIGAVAVAGTLSYTGSGETTDRVIDLAGTTGGATISANGTGALLFSSNLTATGVGAKTLTLSGNSEANIDNTIQGAIVDSSSGATSVTKSGANTWVLSGNNSYTGATVVGTAGTLKLGSAGSGGNGPLGTVAAGTTVNSGGTLDLNGFTLANAEALTLSGNGVSTGTATAGALLNSSATGASYSGLLTLAAATKIVANGNIALTNAGTITGATFGLTLDGTSTNSSIASIIGTTTGGLTKQGSGTWLLTGANTYTGITTLSGGTLSVSSLADGGLSSSIGASTNAATNLRFGNGTTFRYTGSGNSTDRLFTINGTAAADSATLDASGSGAVNFTNTGSVAYGTTNQTRSLNLTGANTGNNTLAAVVANNGTGAVSVNKSGTGKWVLSGANTYTGSTSVSGGTLLVSGTLTATSGINVSAGTFEYTNAGALNRAVTLTGGTFRNNGGNYTGVLTFTSGTIAGTNFSGVNLTIGTGQTLSPGNSPGTIATGSEVWASGGAYLWEINALTTSTIPGSAGADPGWDLANITGTLSITAGVGQFNLNVDSLLALDNWNSGGTYSWRIATASGGVTGFNSNIFNINTSAFSDQNSISGGSFTVTNVGNDVFLNYAAVPEPSTYAMFGLGLLFLWVLRRRSRRAV